jgi:hypothetical protein
VEEAGCQASKTCVGCVGSVAVEASSQSSSCRACVGLAEPVLPGGSCVSRRAVSAVGPV